MLSSEASIYLRNIFKKIFESVKPKELISSQIKVSDNRLVVNNEQYSLNNNCYVVGFGKAVYDMGCEVQKILKRHLIEGILCVPDGSLSSQNSILENNYIKVYEGAKNNIPDQNSYLATCKILELVDKLKEDDLLLVLISGGGSALLVSPVAGVSLEEKALLIQQLARSGADINELNAVRTFLSQVKGGQLAMRAHPATVLTLILSDVIGDPLEVIASGPTVLPVDRCPLNILNKYCLTERVPPNVLKALTTKSQFKLNPNVFPLSHVHIIGNNTRALSVGKLFIENGQESCCILTACLHGQVEVVAKALANFLYHSCNFSLNKITEFEFKELITNVAKSLEISEKKIDEYISLLLRKEHKIYLLLGGETTVCVKGKGKGGRNMELALRFSYEMNVLMENKNGMENFEIGLLSGGTDGIDGPTDAAGAIGYPQQVKLANQQGLNIAHYIENNDSYNFYRTFNAGQDLIITGHTGTNVMDVIIIYMRNKFL